MRVIVDFRMPEDETWQERGEEVLRTALANFAILRPANPSDSVRVMDQMTADMKADDLVNFKRSVRYVAAQFSGPVASVSVLRQGYLRLRLRGYDFGDLHGIGQGLVTHVMQKYGPGTDFNWQLARCEIRERGGGKGFLYGAWLPGYRSYWRFLFRERRAFFIVALFVFGLALELALTFLPSYALPTDWNDLGLRLGAPMLVSSAVLLLEKWAQWLDQRTYRLVWSPRPRTQPDQKIILEP